MAAIPVEFIRNACKYDAKLDVAHGQAILWSTGKGCVQGMTELTECVRTEDPWLLQVQNEMRAGNWSEDSWNFLHGRDTVVPGIMVGEMFSCGNAACPDSWSARRIECVRCQNGRLVRRERSGGAGDSHQY